MGGESYKIWGSVLVAATVMLGIGVVVNEVSHSLHQDDVMAFKVEVPEGGGQPASAPAADTGPEPIAPLLAAADASAGATAVRRCQTCHSFDKGGPNKVGPNLFDIVGGAKAHLDNYSYSPALQGAGGEWSYEDLNHFIADPKGFLAGTKMTFAGVRSAEDRADIIAYMREQSDNPPPLPEPEPEAEAGEGQEEGQDGAQQGEQTPPGDQPTDNPAAQ